MNALWSYFWPAFGIGLAIGILAGAIAFRLPRARWQEKPPAREAPPRDWIRRRNLMLASGAAASILAAALWHGPLGAADRFASQVEREARQTLIQYEMTQVTAHLHHGPLTRRLVLAGPADDFQSAELVRIMSSLPGVSSAQWSSRKAGMPLIIEGAGAAMLGFLLGLLLAYLVELRRRYNAQWNW